MMHPIDDDPSDVYTVSQLNLEVRELLETHYPPIWLKGEISNLARPRSGHIYFSLKDDTAQVRAAMFRMHNRRLEFAPENGLEVLVHARVSLYTERGDYQLIVQSMREAGQGDLQRAFDALKRKLASEGLFDRERKRALPTLPRAIAVITSPTGAALRDILSVLARRFPSIPVVVYPVAVQGEAAPAQIVAAIERASVEARGDVIVLARGGGSLEDLRAFNDESVARAIARCPIALVCGVGHETDFTIADFVADARAATPSAAAELVSPDANEWRARRDRALRRLHALVSARIRDDRQALGWLIRQLRHPRTRLAALAEHRNALLMRLHRAISHRGDAQQQRLTHLLARLQTHAPQQRIVRARERALALSERAHRAHQRYLERHRQRALALIRALEAMGPQATLERGYAIVTRDDDQQLVRSTFDVTPNQALTARVADGSIALVVRAPTEPK